MCDFSITSLFEVFVSLKVFLEIGGGQEARGLSMPADSTLRYEMLGLFGSYEY